MRKFLDFILNSSFDRIIIELLLSALFLWAGDLLEFEPLTYLGGSLFFICVLDTLLLVVKDNIKK